MGETKKRSRVLFLTQVLPYPLAGGAKIRAYYMLRQLAKNHQVTLLSFVREDDDISAVAHLRQICDEVHTVPMQRSWLKNGLALIESVVRQLPLIIVRDRLTEMEAIIRELIDAGAYDVIHADQTSMAQYGLYARDVQQRHRSRVVLDQHNALYLLFQRQAKNMRGLFQRLFWTRESRLLAKYEASLLRNYDEILTVTSNDRDALLELLAPAEDTKRREHMTVVPICVAPESQALLCQEAVEPTIVHLGTMFWPPNVEGVLWFANRILPRIVKAVPKATFVIAGKNPPQEVRELATTGSELSDHIQVTGFIEDPQPLLASSKVFVVPLLAGGGMRVKILDAWQWGLPIVSTSIGAEGIAMKEGVNIMIADQPQLFADAVVRLLTEPDLANMLRDNGRRWVEEHYDWRKGYKKVDNIYLRLEKGR